MSLGKLLPFSSSTKLPQIGLGTWLSKSKEVENAVRAPFRVHITYRGLIKKHPDRDRRQTWLSAPRSRYDLSEPA